MPCQFLHRLQYKHICVGIILSQTRTPVSWPFRGLTTDFFQVHFVFHRYDYFAGSSLIILTWPRSAPHETHGILLAGWWQTYIGPMLAQLGISRGKYVGPTWQLVAITHGPQSLATHVWPMRVSLIGYSTGLWDFAIWGSVWDQHRHE